jgi:hypothetical protein
VGDWAVAKGAAATFSPVMPISTCTCVGSVPSPTMPMSRFMDATASFTGVSLEMPKKVRSAETLSAKDGDAITLHVSSCFSTVKNISSETSEKVHVRWIRN